MTKRKDNDARLKWDRVRELKELHGTDMRNLANTFLDDPDAANDVMHAAFRRLRRRKAAELADDGKLPRLLAGIVIRKCQRYLG